MQHEFDDVLEQEHLFVQLQESSPRIFWFEPNKSSISKKKNSKDELFSKAQLLPNKRSKIKKKNNSEVKLPWLENKESNCIKFILSNYLLNSMPKKLRK